MSPSLICPLRSSAGKIGLKPLLRPKRWLEARQRETDAARGRRGDDRKARDKAGKPRKAGPTSVSLASPRRAIRRVSPTATAAS